MFHITFPVGQYFFFVKNFLMHYKTIFYTKWKLWFLHFLQYLHTTGTLYTWPKVQKYRNRYLIYLKFVPIYSVPVVYTYCKNSKTLASKIRAFIWYVYHIFKTKTHVCRSGTPDEFRQIGPIWTPFFYSKYTPIFRIFAFFDISIGLL